MNTNSIYLTIHLTDSTLTDEECNDATGRLLNQLEEMDEINNVHRITDPNSTSGQKAGIMATLIGLLGAEVTVG
ncbi:MAG: hypothetical protein WCA35_25335, partial [Kovacikia sp.]